MIRKIELMHKLFGTADGKCRDCCHFISGEYQSIRNLKKCEIYGMTHSSASDWAQRYNACGLFNKETNHRNVIRLVKSRVPAVQNEDVLEGQIRIGEMDGK